MIYAHILSANPCCSLVLPFLEYPYYTNLLIYVIPHEFNILLPGYSIKSNLELLPLPRGERIGRFNESIKFDCMIRRAFDSSFKKMAVELSYAKGSVKEAVAELGIDPGRISKWRQQQDGSVEKRS